MDYYFHKIIKRLFVDIQIAIKLNFSKILYLSIGENCLPDNILQRHGIKSFSTPFSSGRGNLDYILALEKSNYNGLFDKANLTYEVDVNGKKVVRSNLITHCDNIYFLPHRSKLEFTHHDLIGSDTDRKNIQRRVKRMQKIKGRKNVAFFYHYRINENSNPIALFRKADELAQLYSRGRIRCHIIIFTQKIISNPTERSVYYKEISSRIHFYEFLTEKIWTGPDQDIFWAKMDDDLVKKMLNHAVKRVTNKQLFLNYSSANETFSTKFC